MLQPGGWRIACDYLADLDPRPLGPGKVLEVLDGWTDDLSGRLGGNLWGPARKALNLFVRDLAYNAWTRPEYRLADCEGELEVPLDGVVMAKIRGWSNKRLRTVTVKSLTPGDSAEYQAEASRYARDEGLDARVHLDLLLWGDPL
jgi:hypothetical protein